MEAVSEERVEASVQSIEERVESSGQLNKVYKPCVSGDCTPQIGMEFESEEAAYVFYNNYGRCGGFSIRKGMVVKSKKDKIVITRKIVCAKEGLREVGKREVQEHRRGIRTDCGAFMYINFNREVERWIVTKFEEEHNHPLHGVEVAHMMPSQRKLTTAQALNAALAVDTGISLKASHDLMSAQVGGREHLGFMKEDLKGYLRARRQRDLVYGEAGSGLFKSKETSSSTTEPSRDPSTKEMLRSIIDSNKRQSKLLLASSRCLLGIGTFLQSKLDDFPVDINESLKAALKEAEQETEAEEKDDEDEGGTEGGNEEMDASAEEE